MEKEDPAALLRNMQPTVNELNQAYDATLELLSNGLELRDKEAPGHTRRVTDLTLSLAKGLKLSESTLVDIKRGALLHDIGNLSVPESILHKPGELTVEEWVTIHLHPYFAYEMLLPVASLRLALDIPYCHHEKWGGTGYPRGLKGTQIPQSARIFAVADVWDALVSDRPYRKAWTAEAAREYIHAQAGKHFDPEIVVLFLSAL